MPQIVIIQGSLSQDSRTALVVKEVEKVLESRELNFQTLDLRSLDLQFCDGRSLKEYNEDMQRAHRVVESADGFIFGMPVYCWSVSGVLKNFIDITSGAMEHKVAGILCTAGGNRSFMASAELIKILYYESSVLTVHPIVYSSSEDFEKDELVSEKVLSKICVMVDALLEKLPS